MHAPRWLKLKKKPSHIGYGVRMAAMSIAKDNIRLWFDKYSEGLKASTDL
jgi:hypothetical protein